MAEKPYVLHFITPLKHVSPFDVNMAADAGWDVITPYSDVELKELVALVQDAIFSRAPRDGKRTAVLIGGRDPVLALDMFEAAKKAMVPPHFEISVMVDPSGAFTTAAAMVAVAEKYAKARGAGLEGKRVAVFGATGPVGSVAGLIAARAGARVRLVGYDGPQRVTLRADQFGERFSVALEPVDGSDDEKINAILETAEIVFCAGRAGLQILSEKHLEHARVMEIAVDVNAVPPPGIAGLDPFADGAPVPGTKAIGVGALAVGNVKFKTEHDLLASMRDAEPRRYLGIDEAFETARRYAV